MHVKERLCVMLINESKLRLCYRCIFFSYWMHQHLHYFRAWNHHTNFTLRHYTTFSYLMLDFCFVLLFICCFFVRSLAVDFDKHFCGAFAAVVCPIFYIQIWFLFAFFAFHLLFNQWKIVFNVNKMHIWK